MQDLKKKINVEDSSIEEWIWLQVTKLTEQMND